MINFFCSGEHANAWEHARRTQRAAVVVGAVLTLHEAVDLGRELWGTLQDERLRLFLDARGVE